MPKPKIGGGGFSLASIEIQGQREEPADSMPEVATSENRPQRKADSVIADGMWGGCKWEISSEGLLVVYPYDSCLGGDTKPWIDYEQFITSAVFKDRDGEKIVVHGGSPYLLSGLTKVERIDASGLDTSYIESMYHMFEGCYRLVSLDVSGWDTSSVTNMNGMFHGCSSLTDLDVSGWDTSSVTSMSCMFQGCTSLVSLEASTWNTASVTDMSYMFHGCASLVSLDVRRWYTASVTDMASMFCDCSSLLSLDASGWDTSAVTSVTAMFSRCSSLRSIYVGDAWCTSDTWEPASVFSGCSSLVGGEGTVFDANNTDGEYARVDGAGGAGYLTRAFIDNGGGVYTINSVGGWDVFCDLLESNPRGYFTGATVVLGADVGTTEIPVTRMAGGSQHDFTGTFYGRGHTLTVRYGTAEMPVAKDRVAPFRSVESGCVIRRLCVAGDVYTSGKHASGLVGAQYGTVRIEDCRVSATIHGSVEGSGFHGGLVGLSDNGESSSLSIVGCAFDGRLLSKGATTDCAGFVGRKGKRGTVAVADSIYAPAIPGDGEVEVGTGSTFVRGRGAVDITNCYYSRALGNTQGKAARTVRAGAGVALLTPGGTDKRFGVSGITAHVGNVGLVWDDVLLAGEGDEVRLSLGRDSAPAGCSDFIRYEVSGGTLLSDGAGGYALAMPDSDVTVHAVFGHKVTVEGGSDGGSVETDKGAAAAGDTVAIHAAPDRGYRVSSIEVNDGSVYVAEGRDGVSSFVMPEADARVVATFEEAKPTLDKGTGVLTLRGEVAPDDVRAFADKHVKYVTCEPGTVLPPDCTGLFKGFVDVITVDLGGADTSYVTNTSSMFARCSSLAAIYVKGDWSMSGVGQSDGMFRDCRELRGRKGTAYSDIAHGVGEAYAHFVGHGMLEIDPGDGALAAIDGGPHDPGYLTRSQMRAVQLSPGDADGKPVVAAAGPGSCYTLPVCPFDAPAGKAFAGWSVCVGGSEPTLMRPDDGIAVTADVFATALWNRA